MTTTHHHHDATERVFPEGGTMQGEFTAEDYSRPEAKLARLNAVLIKLIGEVEAHQDLPLENRSEVLTGLREVARNTMITSALFSSSLIAVAGPQGAGKTTLVKEIYGLSGGWLVPNMSRGEEVPVMIVEADVDSPEGVVYRLDVTGGVVQIVQEELGVEEWARSLKRPTSSTMIHELRVPASFFQEPGRGLLLLPGYEVRKGEQPWQGLMRRALVASPGAIVVTDRQMLATDEADLLISDLRQACGDSVATTVCISRTESVSDAQMRADLVERAREVFDVPSTQVVLTGAGPGYIDSWRAQLLMAIDDQPAAASARATQLQQLTALLSGQLNDLLTQCRDARTIEALDPANNGYEEILGAFDASVASARRDYEALVTNALGSQMGRAESALHNLAKESGGYQGAWESFVNWVTIRSNEAARERNAAIVSCWNEASTESGLSRQHADILRATQWSVANRALTSLPSQTEGPPAVAATSTSNPYAAQASTRYDIASMALPATIIQDAQFLAGAEDGQSPDGLQTHSPDLVASVRFLPAAVLEALRVQMETTDVRVERTSIVVTEPDSATLEEKLSHIAANRRALLTAGIAVLGIDVLADGTLNSVPALAGALQTFFTGPAAAGGGAATAGAAAGVSTAFAMTAGGLMALGTTAALVQYANVSARREFDRGVSILIGARDLSREAALERFDTLMASARDRLESRLRGHLRVDEAVVNRLRLEKALADVASASEDVLRDPDVQNAVV